MTHLQQLNMGQAPQLHTYDTVWAFVIGAALGVGACLWLDSRPPSTMTGALFTSTINEVPVIRAPSKPAKVRPAHSNR